MTDPRLALRLGTAAAYRAARDHPHVDDIAQEAALRVLAVLADKPDASTAYLGGVARNRVRDLLRGKPWTGEEGTRGNERDPLRRAETAHVELAELDLSVDEDPIERVEWSTLRPELEAAIESIPVRGSYGGVQRETARDVARLVMAGCSAGEAGRRLGLTDTAGRKAWASTARPHLATRLAHLKEFVS